MLAEQDQRKLAGRASICVGAFKNMKNGHGCTLRTLIRVLRVLDKEKWLETLSQLPTVSPIEILRQQKQQAPRQRAYKPRKGRISADGGINRTFY